MVRPANVTRRIDLARAVAMAIAMMLTSSATAENAFGAGRESMADPSPAGCRIEKIDNPHFADSVPGAVKVNAKSQCNTVVPEQDLSVTLLVDGEARVKTTTNAKNKAYLLNQDTFVRCSNLVDEHQFQGAALGVSYEDGEPYLHVKTGPVVTLRCGL